MERVAKVGEYWIKGKSYRTIAELLGISPAQVGRDLSHARMLWQKSTMATLDALLSAELARIDQVEAEAWRGWARSQQTLKETTRERSITSAEDDEGGGITDKRSVKKKQHYGDAMFLKIALDCVEKRLKILAAIKEETGESDDIVVQAVEVIVSSREEAQGMLTYEDFRKIAKQD